MTIKFVAAAVEIAGVPSVIAATPTKLVARKTPAKVDNNIIVIIA